MQISVFVIHCQEPAWADKRLCLSLSGTSLSVQISFFVIHCQEEPASAHQCVITVFVIHCQEEPDCADKRLCWLCYSLSGSGLCKSASHSSLALRL